MIDIIEIIAKRWNSLEPERQLMVAEALGGVRHSAEVASYFENLMIEIIDKRMHLRDNDDKRTKGYGYDSLCWRYKCAREQQALYEIRSGRDSEQARKMANRDISKFAQILDDLIGEHD